MADVARLAGVSHQTVSRVINGGVVAADTRERVLEAIRMLDYRPNPAARALVTGRSKTIGVVSFDTTLHGPASALLAIERAAHEHDYFTSMISLQELDGAAVLDAVRRFQRQGVEGIAVIAPELGAVDALPTLPSIMPIVALEAGPETGFPLAAIDQEAGAIAATKHLLELGHATVLHVAGPPAWDEAERRIRGWRDALRSAGAVVRDPLRGDWSPRSSYALGRELLEMSDVTAVFVASDQMALGLLRALHEAGRSVPEDISIVGFDDIPEAQYFTPPLTTVRQPFAEMGRLGFEMLVEEIAHGGRSSRRALIAPELIVRASTGPPRRA